jgi:nitrate reductase gamma subunit
MQNIWILTASIKIFCIQQFQMQNILHFVQDLTLLIKIPWISLVSSSSLPFRRMSRFGVNQYAHHLYRIAAASLHPFPDRRRHLLDTFREVGIQ